MVGFLRTLVAVGALEALGFALIYVWSDWRRDRVGWYLMGLGGSTALLLTLSMVSWLQPVPLWLWAFGLVAFDLALGLQLRLVLRRRARQVKEDRP